MITVSVDEIIIALPLKLAWLAEPRSTDHRMMLRVQKIILESFFRCCHVFDKIMPLKVRTK